jgi:hypothetical protein
MRSGVLARSAQANRNGVVAIPPDITDLVPGLLRGANRTANFVQQLLGDDAVAE